jgi:NAD(P)-dependent dehydrogenase (short-subunit alcohol dehydrogenase family)
MTAGSDDRCLLGRTALVTGGASGLGAAICRDLASAGAHVAVADINLPGASCVAEEIQRSGGDARALPFDVRDERSVDEGIQSLAARRDGLNVIVNCAGIDTTGPVEALRIEDWDCILAVNLRGPFVVSRAGFEVMGRSGGGHIVNIVSTAARRAWAEASAYHASKWGLLGLSHALHVEGRARGIKVTAVIAGGMRTPFLLDRFPGIDQQTLQDPANVARAVRFVLTQPPETVIPEIMVLPIGETSWP